MSTQSRIGLRVDLYDGAYGKTLRIATRNPNGIVFLRSIFEALAERKILSAVLDRDRGVYMKNCKAIILNVTEISEKPIELIELKCDETGTTIVWGQPPDGWRRCCGLIDGLTKHGRGHQYLADMEPCPIIIELSYRE